jgi:Ca2+-binding EF-hand superfamily protein
VRNYRTLLFGLVGLVLLLIGAGTGLTQFQGRGGPQGQGGPGGGRMMDPNSSFGRYSNGKDFIVIAEAQSRTFPEVRQWMESYAQRNGITNGMLTREQFVGFFNEVLMPSFQARMQGMGQQGPSGPGGPGNFTKGGPGGPGAPQGGPGGWQGGQQGPSFDEDRARRRFHDLDKNGDGVIDYQEASDPRAGALQEEFQRWDANQNGVIEWEEYRAYYQARTAYLRGENQGGWGPGGWGPGSEGQPGQPEEQRPVVYRANNLPKELQPWFAQLDKDQDGQIALWEWKEAGGSTAQFRQLDVNMDGFITVEEALRGTKKGLNAQALLHHQPSSGDGEEGTETAATDNPKGPGFMKGMPGGGFNKGGWQGKNGNQGGGFNKGGSGGPPGGFNKGGGDPRGGDPRSKGGRSKGQE